MSYKYSKGSQVIGDLKAADDTQRDTLIDFGEDKIDLQTSGTVRITADNGGVYIPQHVSNTTVLRVSGNVEIGNGSDLTFQKGADDIAFIKFREGSDGTSYNGYLGYSAAEDIYISPGRGADFFVQSRTNPGGAHSGNQTFPFIIMDDGTVKFTKGLTDTSVRSADMTGSTAFYVSGTLDGNNNAVFLGRVGIGTESPQYILDVKGDVHLSGSTIIDTSEPKLIFKEGGSNRVEIGINDSDNLVIENKSTNKHIVFKVNDEGTVREGLRLDGAVPEVVVNQNSSSLIDFRVESSGNTHMLFVDGGNDKVGIGTSSPSHMLDINGDIRIRGNDIRDNSGNKAIEFDGSANVTIPNNLSFGDVMLLELSVPNVDLQTDTYAHRIYAPYNLDIDNVMYVLDSHNTSGNVTVTLTNTTSNTLMSSVTMAGNAVTGSDNTITSASVAQGDSLTFAITEAAGVSQGLHAMLYFRRSI